MTWFKVDDSFYDHPKVFDAPDCAMALWTRAGCWAARNLTDGFVPSGMPARLCDDPDTAVKELVRRKLWLRVKDGYRFHDWIRYQPTRESVHHDREAATERKRKERERRKLEKGQVKPPSVTDTSRRDTPVTPPVTHGGGHNSPSRPDPTSSSSEEEGSPAAPDNLGDDTTKKGTRIPADFPVTPQMVQWSGEKCPDVDGRTETDKFIRYWQTKPGKDALKLSWRKTWQNWMSSAQQRITERAQQNGQNGRLSGGLKPESNAPKAVPSAEKCPKHPSFREGTCGPCRADRLAGHTP